MPLCCSRRQPVAKRRSARYVLKGQACVDPPCSHRMAQQQSNCAILKGQFFWAAAASVVHRVCRVGRGLKAACSKEMLGVRGGQCDEGVGIGNQRHGTASGPQPPANRGAHRPQAKRGRHCPVRKSRRDDNRRDAITDHSSSDVSRTAAAAAATNRPRRIDGDTLTGANTETGDARKTTDITHTRGYGGEGQQTKKIEQQPGAGNPQDGPPEQAEGPGAEEKADRENPPRATLSKEGAFLKATEVTEGGQGAMLFSEFVEALTRLCLARYGPRATARAQGLGASSSTSGTAAARAKTGGGKKLGVVGRRTDTALRITFAGKPLVRGRSPNVRRRVTMNDPAPAPALAPPTLVYSVFALHGQTQEP